MFTYILTSLRQMPSLISLLLAMEAPWNIHHSVGTVLTVCLLRMVLVGRFRFWYPDWSQSYESRIMMFSFCEFLSSSQLSDQCWHPCYSSSRLFPAPRRDCDVHLSWKKCAEVQYRQISAGYDTKYIPNPNPVRVVRCFSENHTPSVDRFIIDSQGKSEIKLTCPCAKAFERQVLKDQKEITHR